MGSSSSTPAVDPATVPATTFAQTAQKVSEGIGAVGGVIGSVTTLATGLQPQATGLHTPKVVGAFERAKRMHNAKRAKYGGCDCVGGIYGGEESEARVGDLHEYEKSLSEGAKEDVIRRVARGMKRAGISIDPEAPLDDVTAQLVKEIPNPRHGKSFVGDAKSQEKVCRIVADVLNDEFTPGVSNDAEKFIDTSFSATEICRKVSEWSHSFASGVNTEFLAVHASVRNALRNLTVVGEVMEKAFGQVTDAIDAAKDDALERRATRPADLVARAHGEQRHLLKVLQNMLHVHLAPAAKELELAMRDSSEAHAVVKRLGLRPGDRGFGDTLAESVSSLGASAAVAQRVNKALKAVGLSAKDYVDSDRFADFEAKLDALIESGAVKGADLAKVLKARNELRDTFEVRGALKLGGRQARRGGDDDDDDEFKVSKTSIEKRLKKSTAETDVITRDFVTRLARHYDELLAAVDAMGPKLGKEIPLTDKSNALREAFGRLSDMQGESMRLELALIGKYVDADARGRKETFVNNLRMISTLCDDIMALEAYRSVSSYFARLRAAIDGIIKTIDFYSDVVTKRGAAEGVMGGAPGDLPVIARSGLSLKKALDEFTYFYYVANVRVNLARTSKELDGYGKGYSEMLGNAIAGRIYQLNKEREAVLARINAAGFNAGGIGNDIKTIANIKKWVTDEYDVKQQFYDSLQAMDLYMKAFTAAIVADPSAVSDIKQIMDGTQTIARWFNEETGENVWRAFEGMQSVVANGAGVGDNGATAITVDAAKPGGANHYYTRVGLSATNDNIGVPTCGVSPVAVTAGDDATTKVKKSVGKAIDNFQSLHNLVNAFARIGDKFGGKDLHKKIFQSPSQIYNSLIKYLKQSALSINHSGAAGAGADPAALQSNPGGINGGGLFATTPAWNVYFGSVGAGTCIGNYVTENKYFAMIVKAMAAKILTTVGVYDMFERVNPRYDLTPVRMIVGGAGDEADPDVLEGAAELYFRLPRLVEFYYGLLYAQGSDGDGYKIAMLPELQGVFAGIIRLSFIKFSSTATGEYSDSELRMLINEINTIYEHFRAKDAGQATRLALLAFVEEINRRYGVMKMSDLQKFWAEIKESRSGQPDDGNRNDTNYAILPDEGDVETIKPAPSDRFSVNPRLDRDLQGRRIGPNGEAFNPFINAPAFDNLDATNITDRGRAMVTDFRTKLDIYMNKASFASTGERSFALHIQQASLEIRRASSRGDKLKAAMGLILSSTVVTTNTDKALMFHETVVTGLNTLSAIETMVTAFDDSLDLMNPKTIEGIIMDTLYLAATNQKQGVDGTIGGMNANMPVDGASFDANELGAVDAPITLRGVQYTFNANSLAGAGIIDRTRLVNEIPKRLNKYANLKSMTIIERYIEGEFLANKSDLRLTTLFSSIVGAAAAGSLWGLAAAAVNIANVSLLRGPKGLPSYYYDTGTEDIPAGDLRGGANVAAARLLVNQVRVIGRILTSQSLIMQDYVNAVFDFSSKAQGLVEVNWVGKSLQLGFSKLQGTVESLLEDVKYYFEQFRPYMPKTVIDRFELKASAGSIYYLEDKLVDKRIRGTNGNASAEGTFNSIGVRTKAALTELTKKYKFRINQFAAAVLALAEIPPLFTDRPNTIQDPESHYSWYGQAFSELLFYGTSGRDLSGVSVFTSNITSLLNLNSFQLKGLVRNARPSERFADLGILNAVPANIAYYPFTDMNADRSLMFAYNQLVAQYLSTVTDQAGSRVYINLVNSFANGVASQSVSTPIGNSFPDITNNIGGAVDADNLQFGIRADPKSSATLFQSLAFILQRLTKDINPTTQISDHLLSTLTDVPLYMKEAYRANLPSFVKLFDALALKGDFIKQFFQKTSVNLCRPNQSTLYQFGGGAAVAANSKVRNGAGNGADFVLFLPNSLSALSEFSRSNELDATMKGRFVAIIDAIAGGAYTLSNAASEVLRELADSPVYFQTQEGSIETYRMRYAAAPLMPLSLSLWTLQDVSIVGVADIINPTTLFPNKTLGSPEFKLLYGARGLIAGSAPVGYDQMPGALALLKSYNGLSEKREQIDEARYLRFAQNVVTTLRYLADARHYKSMLIGRAGGVVGVSFNFVSASAVYALQSVDQTAAVLSVVESSNQPDEITNIINKLIVGAASATDPRATERTQNLIDMNIIPINVHALMRDIPLANLYNYEYTFEQMVCSLFGEVGIKGTDAEMKNTKQMFLRLLKDPYMEVSDVMYGNDNTDLGSQGYVQRIFRGDNDLGLGRPKFLSDQLFNKALFGSVYQSPNDYDEGGPGVGIGAARGRALQGSNLQEASAELRSILNEIAGFRARYNNGNALAGGVDGDAAHLAALAVLEAMPIAGWNARLTRVRELLPTTAGDGGANQRVAVAAIIAELNNAANGFAILLAAAKAGAPPVQATANTLFDQLDPGVGVPAQITAQLAAGANTVAGLAAAAGPAAGRRLPGAIPADNWRAQAGRRGGTLTYLTTPDDTQQDEGVRARSIVKSVSLVVATKKRLQQIGKARFDTTFVRNLFFITNVSRVVRLKLSRELTQTRNVLVSSHEALAAGVTEYGTDAFGSNDVFGSTLNGQSRFND